MGRAPRAGVLPDRLPGMTTFADGQASVEKVWERFLAANAGFGYVRNFIRDYYRNHQNAVRHG